MSKSNDSKAVSKKSAKTGPEALKGSLEARKLASVILEVLAGTLNTTEASELLGIAQPRYYQLETRGLQGLILALEARPKGRQKSKQSIIEDLKADKARLQRELHRCQALLRSSQRALGLSTARKKVEVKRTSKKRKRQSKARGLKVAAELRRSEQNP